MIKPRSTVSCFMEIILLLIAFTLFGYAKIMADQHTAKMKAEEVIRKSVATFAFLEDGRIFFIARDGSVMETKELPREKLPREVGKAKRIVNSQVSVIAESGTPVEVSGNIAGEAAPYCYVYDNVTGQILGDCPKEQYLP